MPAMLIRYRGTAREEAFDAAFAAATDVIQRAHALVPVDRALTQAQMNVDLPVERGFWLAEAGGLPIATLGASLSTEEPSRGYIGFFAAAPGPQGEAAATDLLQAARTWLNERGATKIFGPVNLTTWFPYRLQDSDFGSDFSAWEPQSPQCYRAIWERAGFAVVRSYFSESTVVDRDQTLEAMAREDGRARDSGYRFRPLRWEQFATTELPHLHRLTVAAFAGADLFEPLPLMLMQSLYVPLVAKGKSGLSGVMALAPDGEPCGYLFGFRDRDAIVLKTIAITPEHRVAGLSLGLMRELLRNAAAEARPQVISALIRDNNASQRLPNFLARFGERTWRHHYVLMGCGDGTAYE